MFGDIVKVTPSSKVVGDMALYMIQNELTEEEVYEKGEDLDFPTSVVRFFKGELGQPEGGFPEKLQKLVLNGDKPLEKRPGEYKEPLDFNEVRKELSEHLDREPTEEEVMGYIMYPQVFLDYTFFYNMYGEVTKFDTPTFFYGMRMGEQVEVTLEKGKTLIIKLNQIGDPDLEGNRVLYFELNGQGRQIEVKDKNVTNTKAVRKKAEPTNKGHVGATMPGSVLQVLVNRGDKVDKGDPIVITEAMKMETTIRSGIAGKVERLFVKEGDTIQTNDLLVEIETK
jgi:pyruvate carboxylase